MPAPATLLRSFGSSTAADFDPSKNKTNGREMTKAKRRSKGQKIGRQGELAFEAWATSGGFSANKLQEDYGVDYACQQMSPTDKGSEEMTGLSVYVQVRATTGKVPRIGLSREDVETALRQTQVFCVAGVKMPSGEVSFRWLDIPLLEEWAEFLKSDRETITMRLEGMSAGVERFSAELVAVSRPFQRAKFAHAHARLLLEVAVPGSRLLTNSGALGDWAAVFVPNVLSIVSAPADAHEDLATAMFRPIPFSAGFSEVVARHKIHSAVLSVGELVDGPLWVGGGAESEVRLEIRLGQQSALSVFTMRRVGDERAYIGTSGLVLRLSDTRQPVPGGDHVHELTWTLEDEGAVDLIGSGQLDFLRLLTAGAGLNEEGRPLIPVEHFGDLGRLARSVSAIERTYTALGLSMAGVKLSDLLNETFAHNLEILELLEKGDKVLIPTFVLGLGDDEIAQLPWERCLYRAPISMVMKEQGVIAWVAGEAEACVKDGVLHGLRFKTQDSAEFELTDHVMPEAGRAVVHLDPAGPAIVLGSKPSIATGIENFPFRAEFLAPLDGDLAEEVVVA
jgi:hypothetical protein